MDRKGTCSSSMYMLFLLKHAPKPHDCDVTTCAVFIWWGETLQRILRCADGAA